MQKITIDLFMFLNYNELCKPLFTHEQICTTASQYIYKCFVRTKSKLSNFVTVMTIILDIVSSMLV